MSVMDATNVPENETPEVEESGLPSEKEENEKSPWERAREDGLLPEDFKEDPYELAKSWKEAQKFVDKANAERAELGKEEQRAQQEAERQKLLMDEIIPEFKANNNKLTDEIKQKALDAGFDEKDIELAYYKFNETATRAYSIVGGEDTYRQMMEEMAPRMSDDQRAAFDQAFQQGLSEYAIKGLYAEWKGSSQESGGRLEGRVSGTTGVKPYANQGEMLADLNYLRTRGKNDIAARKKYEARKAVTPDEVIFNRR